ncbi:PhnA domain-containing protein [uncultured Gilvimarinus sp.]|uniref:PhnA domain-containing protein n=1 Tax=uncultured Gilvimarinus sp. TaxID=1689143 RepID=UPI0030EBA46D|tara:strand:+ start:2230 stop:2790 length:561 start_codon:yes stop_codon:yes gene_type:complete
MPLDNDVQQRSDGHCELCGADAELSSYALPHSDGQDERLALCAMCTQQADAPTDLNHLRCLTTSIWSTTAAAQVLSYRLLHELRSESWAQEQLDMAYLEDDIRQWAEAGISQADEHAIVHKDSNGVTLAAGDTVTIIKDLNVKGTSFVAKRGTAVRGISLTDNPAHIEGRVNGTRIVILTEFVKKN